MIKIAFLVNPISGKSGNRLELKELKSHLNENEYEMIIQYSSSKNNLSQLTKNCIENKVDIIVAVGGDGTVNTVAKHLIHSTIKLGILPRGSGNGIAGHLNMIDSVEYICSTIKRATVKKIDCGVVNQHYFFSNFALGYPAEVIHKYDQDLKRGFSTYFKHSVNTLLNRRNNNITIPGDDKLKYCVLISNTKFLGYNVSLTPQAQINNGFLDLVYAHSRRNLSLKMSNTILFKRNYATRIKELEIHTVGECPAQLDGEPLSLTSPYHITVKHSCVNVLV